MLTQKDDPAPKCAGATKAQGQEPRRKSARIAKRSVPSTKSVREHRKPESSKADSCAALDNTISSKLTPSASAAIPRGLQKRRREAQDSFQTSSEERHKRRRSTSPPDTYAFGQTDRLPTSPAVAITTVSPNDSKPQYRDHDAVPNPVAFWALEKRWPKIPLEQAHRTWTDLEGDHSDKETMDPSNQVVQYVEIDGRQYPRPIRRAPTSGRRKGSDSSLSGSIDPKQREAKSAQYRDIRYERLLAIKGSFMDESEIGTSEKSKTWCLRLLETRLDLPAGTLFQDNIFDETIRDVRTRNEARVIQDISRLIVPSVETLRKLGSPCLKGLIENVNEGWQGAIPVEGSRPQPDYCVGFRRLAFTEEQLKRLDPLIGTIFDNSFFVATYQMYFPFLTCEVKCGAAALDVADRQNAHSMTIAVRAVVMLFRAVHREKELHREILAFSISHDYSSVRIYGHYALIEDQKVTFYRHPIHKFDITALDGRDKWTAYTFTKNVYDTWMPKQLERISSAIGDIPLGISFDISQASDLSFGAPDSQAVEGHSSQHTIESGQSSLTSSQDPTPNTSLTGPEERTLKRPKKRP